MDAEHEDALNLSADDLSRMLDEGKPVEHIECTCVAEWNSVLPPPLCPVHQPWIWTRNSYRCHCPCCERPTPDYYGYGWNRWALDRYGRPWPVWCTTTTNPTVTTLSAASSSFVAS